jgi:hypothetical protein
MQTTRQSSVTTHHDTAGEYEVEVFDAPKPKRVIVTAHGNGVRRWDGEKFFYAVAEHCADSAVMLVDQNQSDGDGCRLNPQPILVARIQSLITLAQKQHPGVPVVVLAHSMGCAVTCFLDLSGVASIIFEAPAAGAPRQALIDRYGPDIVKGKTVTTSDGLRKVVPLEYIESIAGLDWEDEYRKLVARYKPVYVFAAGDEEIVSDERLEHEHIFKHFEIIPHATHNLSGAPLADFLRRLDKILEP